MDITWLGHSCFKIKGKDITVVTDPYDEITGYKPGKISADIVTVSHQHPRHSCIEKISGTPKVLLGPGEYEISGVFIYGSRSYLDTEKGKVKGKNTIYLMDIEGIKVCHLGDLGHSLSASQVEEISDADIVMVPVGGAPAIDAAGAVEIINVLEPKIVIPMHYKSSGVNVALEPIDKFLKEMGVKEVSPQPKLSVSKSMLPIEMQVVVLEPKN